MYAPSGIPQMPQATQENMKMVASQRLGADVPKHACEAELFERRMNELANFADIVRGTVVKTMMHVCPPQEVSANKQAEPPRQSNSGYFISLDEIVDQIGRNLSIINETIRTSAFYQD